MPGLRNGWWGAPWRQLKSSRQASRRGPTSARAARWGAEQLEDRRLLTIGPLGPEFLLNTTTASHQQYPQVATDGLGNYVVSWESDQEGAGGYGVYAQRFDSAGDKVGPEIHVNTYTNNFQGGSDVAMAPDGKFVVVWASTGQIGASDEVYMQRFDAAGNKVGGEVRVNTYTTNKQNDPAVSIDNNGNYTVVWSSYGQDGSSYGVYSQRYNSSGVAQGSEFRVNTTTSNTQAAADIAIDADGDMVIVWNQLNLFGTDSEVFAQRYNSSGVAQGGQFRVNTVTSGKQLFPAIAADDAGNFVVTWGSDGQDGSGNGQYAQRYNAAGVAQGGEFRANTHTANHQFFGPIAMTPSGDFVISWSSLNQDGSGYGVYAQRYNAAGVAQDGEFQVNTTTAGNQFFSTVAIDNTGENFLVTWSSFGQDGGGYGNYGQRYGESNTPPVADAGGPYTIAEGGSLALDASGSSDVDNDPLTYSWDVNGDNTFGDASGVAPTLNWAQLQALGINNGLSTRNVKVRVDDGNGGVTTSATVLLTINNTSPTIALTGNANVNEGSTYSLTLGAVTDPGADTVAQWIVHWGDGNSDTYATNGVKTHVYADGNANRTITVDLVDEDGTHTAAGAKAVAVNNLAPAVSAGSAGTIQAGSTFTGSGLFTDPGADSWTATVDYGDGAGGQALTLNPDKTFSLSHLYTIGGPLTVLVSVTDDDAGLGTASFVVTVDDLNYLGTAGDDTLVLTYQSSGNATVQLNGGPLISVSSPSSMTFDGLGGSDSITLVGTANADAISLAGVALSIGGLTVGLTSVESQTVNGLGGNDTFTVTATAVAGTTLDGGANDDTFIMQPGGVVSSVIGGSGSNTLNYGPYSTAVTVNLGTSSATAISTLSGVQNVTGGSGADSLTGDANANVLIGAGGNDTLTGAAGNDWYLFDADSALGSDAINETLGGIDTLDFSPTSTQAISINLATATAQVINASLTLNLQSATTIENVVGGDAADTLTGNTLGNRLIGGAGNDTLTGSSGNDIYTFDADSPLGSDTINEAGGGIDVLDFASTTTLGVTVNLANPAAQTINANLTLNLQSGSTMDVVTGTPHSDTLSGNSLANTLVGGAGDDLYLIDADSPQGADTLNEASGGTDTIDFSATTTLNVAVNLGLATNQVVNANQTLNLISATAFENVVGGALNDTLTGNSVNNTLTGGAGNDTYPLDADVAQGSDTIDESGGGTDHLNFTLTTLVPVAVDLSSTAAQAVHANLTLTLTGGADIENLTGGSLGDTLAGNALNNLLTGGAGNDTYRFNIDTAQGSDTLSDTSGTDTLDFSSSSTQGAAVNLTTATAQTVNANLTLNLQSATAFENAIGGGGNDALTGNTLANRLAGNAGNDTLVGGVGNDVYLFDADSALGSDTLDEIGGGIDTLDFSSTTTQTISVNLATTTAQTVNANLTLNLQSAATMENVLGGALADALTGNALGNALTGGAGNDTLTGGAGNDVYLFDADSALGSDTLDETGGGVDTLDFSLTTTQAIAADLAQATAQTINANLTLNLQSATTFENATGGGLADALSGNALANALIGNADNDTLTGNAGNDTLTGNAGDDSLTGGANDDRYLFDADASSGADTLDESGGGIDTLDFALTTTVAVAVNLSTATAQTVHANLSLNLQSGSTVENIVGGSLADTLTGNALNNTLTGGAGNDTLTGGAGNDVYLLDADSALGSDTLDESGGGSDTLDFSLTTTQAVTVNLATATVQTVNGFLSLNLQSGSTVENVIGGSLADTLTGNALNNTLTGGAGNDTLTGAAGNDAYAFDCDLLLGSDTLDETGGGSDTLDFSLTSGKAILLDLSQPAAQVINSNLTLTLGSGVAFENITGGAFADNFIGNALDNLLLGGAGNDIIAGGDGRDLLLGGSGLDSLTGGNGEDIVSGGISTYYNETTGIVQTASMQSIMAEWSRLDLAYAARVANLLVGGGLSGGNALSNSTVLNETVSAVDQLFGGADLDWFFQKVGSDVLNDLVGGETTTVL